MNRASEPVAAASPRRGRSAGLLLAAALAIGAAGWWASHRGPQPLALVGPVTIAVPTQINSAPLIVAGAQNLFQQAGVAVVNQPFLLGKDALNSLLDGHADLAVVADTPFIHARLGGQDVALLASISQARRALAIVARQDRAIHRVEDLAGKSIALTLGTNFPYFLDAMLQAHGLADGQVRLVDRQVDAVIAAFKSGEVDAAVVFQPYLAQMQAQMQAQPQSAEPFTVFFGEDLYAFRFLLVGRPTYIDSHPQEVQRVLRALLAAAQSMQAQPALARRAIGGLVQVDDAVMAKLFDPEDYRIDIDPALLLALDDQTRWAMRRGLAKPGPVPNYLEAIRFAPLEAVWPSAVKVTH
jgi:ABC-type nitrate/sulfonate/bicarbonate transport system substrate-binding protein